MLRFSMLWLALACWNAAPVIADTVPHRLPRALLITGLGTADPGHPKHILRHEFYNDEIARALEGIVDVTVTEDLQSLNPATLRNHDLILNNSFLLEPSPDQLTAFFEFIEQGGSYIALHAGLESFVNSPRYVRMMGGRLAGHSPLRPFIVETFEEGFGTERSTPWSHPITRGMPVFETQDELYVVQTNTQELEVIARGESHPIVWWRPWYNGSVLAFTLGHSRASVQNAGYQALLRNCVRWLLGYPIIEPLHRVVLSNDAGEVEDVLDLRRLASVRGAAPMTFTAQSQQPDLLAAEVDEDQQLDLRVQSGRAGTATIIVKATAANGRTARAEMVVKTRPRGSGNLAEYHQVTAQSSSSEARYSTADPMLVIDGDLTTRWSSNYTDDEWICLDLNDEYLLDRTRFRWEGAFAAEYEIQVSNDARSWSTVARRSGQGGVEEVGFAPIRARFIRMLGKQRATEYGYSLHEFEVYGSAMNQ